MTIHDSLDLLLYLEAAKFSIVLVIAWKSCVACVRDVAIEFQKGSSISQETRFERRKTK